MTRLELGIRLRAYRVERELSTGQIADCVGMNDDTWGALESGTCRAMDCIALAMSILEQETPGGGEDEDFDIPEPPAVPARALAGVIA